MFSLVEKHLNAFSLPPEYSLALCVSEDLQFSAGPAVYFKYYKFVFVLSCGY